MKKNHRTNSRAGGRGASTSTAGAQRPKGAQPGNQNAVTHGFYSDHFTEDELARVAQFVTDPTLDDEIWMMRVVARRLLGHAAQDGNTETIIKASDAMSAVTGRIAALLRTKRALKGDAADGLAGAVAAVLDELSTELGIEL